MSVQVRVQRAVLALRELLPGDGRDALDQDTWITCNTALLLLESWQHEQQHAAVAETEDPFGNTR